METYTVTKDMENTFDFGYEATIDMKNKIVKATVYDHDDDDILTMSFIVCDTEHTDISHEKSDSHIIYITGVYCMRNTCFGTDIITSFEEANMGYHIIHELGDIFKNVFPNGVVRLYSDFEFKDLCRKYTDEAVNTSYTLSMSSLPLGVCIDIAKRNIPEFMLYTHDVDAIQEKLQTYHRQYMDELGRNNLE